MLRFLLLALLATACQSSSVTMSCVPGASSACACTDGEMGAQLCNAQGTFDPCVCTPADAGAIDAKPSKRSDAAHPDAGPDAG